MGQRYHGLAEWRQVVPVAFHVDYWDQLGWKDRFAKPEFSSRQQLYSASWERGSVYTPCFVLNGEELQGLVRLLFSPIEQPAIVRKVESTVKNNIVSGRFLPATTPKENVVFVAPPAMITSTS